MKNKIFLTLFVVIITQSYSQSKRVADKYFKNFAYPKAAELYESIYKKGDSSKLIISRIADSYFNNAKTKESEYWYKKLVAYYPNELSDETLFKYAQSVRSNGNYVKSDSLLSKVDKEVLSEIREKTKYLFLEEEENKTTTIKNLSINTSYSDFGAFIFKDEFYFASTAPKSLKKQAIYKWNNQPYLNIYKSSLGNKNVDTVAVNITDKEILEEPVNTKYHESNPVITKNGKTMYFTRVNYVNNFLREDKKQTINLKLLKATLVDNKWTNIVELPFNSDQYSVGHPALSPDEKTLYFTSDMPGSIGETDIYKVSIGSDNTYGEPQNLGETINTKEKEMFPFVSENNELYFSSDGHLGIGLLDIFKSTINSNGSFSKPINLEEPYNSKRDDFSYYINKKGDKGFFSSNREGGKGDDDIYSFAYYNKPKPIICEQVITGIVKDSKTGMPLPNATVKLISSEGIVVKEVESTEKGFYTFKEVDCNTSYTVRGTKLNYKADNTTAKTTSVSGEIIKTELNLTPLIIEDKIVISSIYFDFDKSYIREEAQYELEHIVTVMKNHPDMVIKIESHTDSRGTKNYNRSLSDRRAKSTRDYIISRGITSNRIESAIGYGEDKLLNNCNDANQNKCSEEEHQLNRRSYFIIVKGGKNIEINNKKPTVIDRKTNK